MSSQMTLTKQDLGPWRRVLDKVVKFVVIFFLGYATSDAIHRVDAIPALKSNSVAWYSATADKFAGICNAIYGPAKTPGLTDEARQR